MKEKTNYESDIIQKKKPKIKISVTNLDIEVEEGKVFRDSFQILSENQVPVKGKVFSTNDKVGLEVDSVSSVRNDITYYFKGKLAIAGSEFEGDLVILTNGGEFNIPYRIRVVPKMVDTTIGKISQMEEFAKLYSDNPKEAVELFFLPNFADVFLKDKPEQKAMYHSLMKGRSKPLIIEEFMTAAGYKSFTGIWAEEKTITLGAGKDRETIELQLTCPGYTEGRIYCEKGRLELSADRFTSNDFREGRLEITVEKNHRPVSGSDVLHLKTMRQDLIIPVEWWNSEAVHRGEQERRYDVKRQKAELMHNYLYFRTGSIGFEDFAQESHRILDHLLALTDDKVWNLYLMHLLLMEESFDEVKELQKEISDYEKEHPFSPLASQYMLYLRAMTERTPDAIGEAVTSIRRFYETSEYKAEALWMLIYLDREYVYNKRLQYDTIKQLFQAGNNSCLLYFEACEILNDNPNYMEEAGAFEISVFRWGVRYGFISMSLAYQFARLALKLKYYSRSIFYIAERLYKVEPDERFLQVICSLLIKGNKISKEYHEYFYQAVEANLKIIGLNEFFIRSMDFQKFEEIPQRVLIYFTYSNSLDYVEKAYLYTNILKNKDVYEEVYGAYYSQMIPFVEEQLLKGRMNEHLYYLYTHFQKQVLEKPENSKAVCDILFYQKLLCKNSGMIGVYISNPETGEEMYYPLSGGTCHVQLVNKRAVIYFVDSAEQRYVTGVDYELKPFLTLEQFPEDWITRNRSNKKILQTLSDRVDETITEQEIPVLQKIAFNQEYCQWMQWRALEKLLVYYGNHQNKKELSRWLEKTDYSNISPAFRKRLMDYYLEVGMTENAFFGIELYGSHIMGAAKRLKLATFGVNYYDNKMDETTLALAWSASVSKKYNKDTLCYLMEHFEGEIEDLLTIWERSCKLRLSTEAFEKKIIRQSMFTGNNTDGVFPVFESFYQTSASDPAAQEYLEYISLKELHGDMVLSDQMYEILGQEIVKGRVADRRVRINFLYHFAEKTQMHEQIHDAAEQIIRELLDEEFYLPVYHAYSDCISFPIDYSERTFLTYRGGQGKNITLYYQVDGEKEGPKERHLLEVLPGMYITSMHFYQSDHVNYHLEADGEPVKNDNDILFETFGYEGDDSRFFELNYLLEKGEEEMGSYLVRAFFTDQFMTLL